MTVLITILPEILILAFEYRAPYKVCFTPYFIRGAFQISLMLSLFFKN